MSFKIVQNWNLACVFHMTKTYCLLIGNRYSDSATIYLDAKLSQGDRGVVVPKRIINSYKNVGGHLAAFY